MVGRDVADPAHIRRQLVNFFNPLAGPQALAKIPQIQKMELIGPGRLELGGFHIRPPDPGSSPPQFVYEVMADKAASPADQHFRFFLHMGFPLPDS